jgi:hypothetical protein
VYRSDTKPLRHKGIARSGGRAYRQSNPSTVPTQPPKGIAVKQPELTQLIGLQDGDGDRLFISRLDRPNGSRGYLLAIRSGEVHGSVFLTARDLDRLSTVIRYEVGDGDDDLMAEFRFFARAIWLVILCALVWLLAFAVTGPLFAYPWSN